MNRYLIGFLLLLLSCRSGQRTAPSASMVIPTGTLSMRAISLSNEILGVLVTDNKEFFTIKVDADSAYYTEHFESYHYKLKGGSIFIYYPDSKFTAKVSFMVDTLVMESEDGQSNFVRFMR